MMLRRMAFAAAAAPPAAPLPARRLALALLRAGAARPAGIGQATRAMSSRVTRKDKRKDPGALRIALRARKKAPEAGAMGGPIVATAEPLGIDPVHASSPELPFKTIGVIGAGVMSQVVVSRTLAITGSKAPNFQIYDIERSQSDRMSENHEVCTPVDSVAEALDGADLVILAVKPQNMGSVASAVAAAGDRVSPDAVVLSVLAGTRTDAISHQLGLNKVVRAMPNTPCALGQGMTVWLSTPSVTDVERAGCTTIFACMGEAIEVRDETFIDMATALTGSGPAYVYLAMEAMVDAGVQMGFPRPTAVKLVQNTFQGTGAYAISSKRHLAQLRNDITSPGGTTAAALATLERGALRHTLTEAVMAARAKAEELGKQHGLPDGMASGLSDDTF